MKKNIFVAFILGVLGFAIAAPGLSSTSHSEFTALAQERQEGAVRQQGRDILDSIPLTLAVDVATDARNFRLNRGAALTEARRGDSFIVEGKIYPAGTLLPGGSLQAPGPFNPDTTSGSIGKWVLRGVMNYDIGEILAGASPAVFGAQYFLFDDGRVLISEGPHAGAGAQSRAIIGGAGSFSGAAGEVSEEILGVNLTGLFNQRFTFKINKQSLK